MEYDLAFQNFEKSARLAMEAGSEAYAGVVYANIGNLLYEQNRLEEALEYFAKGVVLEEKHGLYGSAGNSYTVIANIYLKLKNLDSSFMYLQKADKYNTEYGNNIGLSYTQYSYSKYYFEKGDYNTSVDYLNKTIDYASNNHLNVLLSDSYKLMSEINAIQRNFKDAYNNFFNFYKIYVEIYDVEKINELKKRIKSHFNGGRGADQFCLYIFDSYIKQSLDGKGASITKQLNSITKEWARENLTVTYSECENSTYQEKTYRKSMQPTLNPL